MRPRLQMARERAVPASDIEHEQLPAAFCGRRRPIADIRGRRVVPCLPQPIHFRASRIDTKGVVGPVKRATRINCRVVRLVATASFGEIEVFLLEDRCRRFRDTAAIGAGQEHLGIMLGALQAALYRRQVDSAVGPDLMQDRDATQFGLAWKSLRLRRRSTGKRA